MVLKLFLDYKTFLSLQAKSWSSILFARIIHQHQIESSSKDFSMTDYHAFFSEDMSYHITHSVLLLVCSIFAILAVALRFWARKLQKVSPELNDYFIVVGLVFEH